MSVKINIASYLQPYTNGNEVVEVDGNTVGQCINHLVQRFPDIQKLLFDENGNVHRYVSIYINNEDSYPDEINRMVKDGDELYLLYAIGGG